MHIINSSVDPWRAGQSLLHFIHIYLTLFVSKRVLLRCSFVWNPVSEQTLVFKVDVGWRYIMVSIKYFFLWQFGEPKQKKITFLADMSAKALIDIWKKYVSFFSSCIQKKNLIKFQAYFLHEALPGSGAGLLGFGPVLPGALKFIWKCYVSKIHNIFI